MINHIDRKRSWRCLVIFSHIVSVCWWHAYFCASWAASMKWHSLPSRTWRVPTCEWVVVVSELSGARAVVVPGRVTKRRYSCSGTAPYRCRYSCCFFVLGIINIVTWQLNTGINRARRNRPLLVNVSINTSEAKESHAAKEDNGGKDIFYRDKRLNFAAVKLTAVQMTELLV
jgi:hypothetical protein